MKLKLLTSCFALAVTCLLGNVAFAGKDGEAASNGAQGKRAPLPDVSIFEGAPRGIYAYYVKSKNRKELTPIWRKLRENHVRSQIYRTGDYGEPYILEVIVPLPITDPELFGMLGMPRLCPILTGIWYSC